MKFRAEEPKVYNDWEEVAKARASIASRGTPLQYRLDGQWEARRQAHKTILLWIAMAVIGMFFAWAGVVVQ